MIEITLSFQWLTSFATYESATVFPESTHFPILPVLLPWSYVVLLFSVAIIKIIIPFSNIHIFLLIINIGMSILLVILVGMILAYYF